MRRANTIHVRDNEPKRPRANEIVEINGKRRTVYRKMKLVGSGTFADVFCCQKPKSKTKVAIKVISKKKISKKPEIQSQVE